MAERYKQPDNVIAMIAQPPEIIRRAEATERFGTFFSERLTKPGTTVAYGIPLARFFVWLESQTNSLQEVDFPLLQSYRDKLDEEFSRAYVNLQLAAIRSLFDWLVTGSCISVNPCGSLRSTQAENPCIQEPISPEEIDLLLTSIDVSTVTGLRDRAMIGLMVYGFASTGTVVDLNLADYAEDARHKGWWFNLGAQDDRRRRVPANLDLTEFMSEYLDVANLSLADAPLFPSFLDRLRGNRLTSRSVQRAVKARGKRASLGDQITPQRLRASSLGAYLGSGGDLEKTRQLAGHSNVVTTSNYLPANTGRIVYEGDLDGLLDVLGGSASEPLSDLVSRSGIFRLSLDLAEDEDPE